jgi:hypothetical protein
MLNRDDALMYALHIPRRLNYLLQPFVLDWLERHDLDNLWDGVHFIGAFQFVADAVKS